MANNEALLASIQSIIKVEVSTVIKAEVSTINKNSNTNTAELTKSITGIKPK